MGKNCCCEIEIKNKEVSNSFKKALQISLALNFSMFLLENWQGLEAHSLSLRADAIDFLGDSANYLITLLVISSAVSTKARVSLMKALFMFGFGMWVLIEAIIRFFGNEIPDSFTMSWVGLLALLVNGGVAYILYKFRDGDSNMQSVWLCSRNDAIGNIAVVLASAGVYFLNSKWPDLIVAFFMAGLSVSASFKVLTVVKKEVSQCGT